MKKYFKSNKSFWNEKSCCSKTLFFIHNLDHLSNIDNFCASHWFRHIILETLAPELKILRPEYTKIYLSISTSAIHYSSAKISYCKHHENTYNYSLQAASMQTISINTTHSNSTCFSISDWHPAKSKIEIQTEFRYILANSSYWIKFSQTGIIADYSNISGNFHFHYNSEPKILN